MKHFCVVKITLLLLVAGFFYLPANAQTSGDEQYEAIFRPDSLLTPSQMALKIKIAKQVYNSIDVRGDSVYVKATQADFEKSEIPAYFYNRLVQDIGNINRFVREGKISAEEVKKQIRQVYDEVIAKLE